MHGFQCMPTAPVPIGLQTVDCVSTHDLIAFCHITLDAFTHFPLLNPRPGSQRQTLSMPILDGMQWP